MDRCMSVLVREGKGWMGACMSVLRARERVNGCLSVLLREGKVGWVHECVEKG